MYLYTNNNTFEDTRTPSLENWGGGFKSLLQLANSPHLSKCPQSTNNTKQPQGLQNCPQQLNGNNNYYNIHVENKPHGCCIVHVYTIYEHWKVYGVYKIM